MQFTIEFRNANKLERYVKINTNLRPCAFGVCVPSAPQISCTLKRILFCIVAATDHRSSVISRLSIPIFRSMNEIQYGMQGQIAFLWLKTSKLLWSMHSFTSPSSAIHFFQTAFSCNSQCEESPCKTCEAWINATDKIISFTNKFIHLMVDFLSCCFSTGLPSVVDDDVGLRRKCDTKEPNLRCFLLLHWRRCVSDKFWYYVTSHFTF